YPDLFFRSAGETYVCTRLWDLGKHVKRLVSVRMYHALAMQGRSTSDWRYYALRSQILVTFMRDPWYLIFLRLASKLGRSLPQYIRWGSFRIWLRAWAGAVILVPQALCYRRPIKWQTQKLLWKLQRNKVSKVEGLTPIADQSQEVCDVAS